jgi:hypothetical protein
MSARPTLLIVSFHFAPSPLVGAKRFSFLAREFTRQGFDVHVVTNEIRESAYGREDKSLPLQGTVHRVPDSIDNFVRFKERGRGWRRFIHGVARRLKAQQRRGAIEPDQVDVAAAGGSQLDLKVELRGERQLGIPRNEVDVDVTLGSTRPAGARSEQHGEAQRWPRAERVL